MLLTDIGPRAYQKASAVATQAFTPLFDRAAFIRRLIIDNPSASDTWIVSINGREIMRFPIFTVGNQQLLGGLSANFPKTSDLFAFFKTVYGQDFILPVPQGATLNVSSVGGATANVVISFEERTSGDPNNNMVNSPGGNRFIVPIFGYRNAAVAAAGEVAIDTQVGPVWFPNLWIDAEVPAGFTVNVLALFLEGGGVNTFSGAANHQSVTDHLALTLNGQRMFTRAAADGIPLIGAASAAGSANAVFNTILDPFPAFQLVEYMNWVPFANPLRLNPGALMQWRLGITGDVTGGASYANFLQCMLVDVQVPS